MLKRIFLFFTAVLFWAVVYGQSDEYDRLVGKADSLYQLKHYKEAAFTYSLADLNKQIGVYEDLADTYYYIGVAYEQLKAPLKAHDNFNIAYKKFTKGHHRRHDYCESLDKVYLSDIEEKLKK